MRTSNLSFLLFFIILFAGACTSTDCTDFHVGKFKYKDKSKGMAPDVIIERTESHQVESSVSANYSDTFKIVWTSDCEYYMVFMSSSNEDRMAITKFDTIFSRITETKPNGYVFQSIFLNWQPEGELVKIE